MTRAPSSTNAKLTARPNPPVPPATNTTLPAMLLSNLIQSTHLVIPLTTAQAAAPRRRHSPTHSTRVAFQPSLQTPSGPDKILRAPSESRRPHAKELSVLAAVVHTSCT